MIIFHITSKQEWEAAQKAGQYLPQAYAQDGFIHTSFKEQVLNTASRFYAGHNGLVLLKIESDKTGAEVKVENLDGGAELFPHIYGPLPTSAVISSAAFEPDASGQFSFPVSLSD